MKINAEKLRSLSRFRLKSLLVFCALASVVIAWLGKQYREVRFEEHIGGSLSEIGVKVVWARSDDIQEMPAIIGQQYYPSKNIWILEPPRNSSLRAHICALANRRIRHIEAQGITLDTSFQGQIVLLDSLESVELAACTIPLKDGVEYTLPDSVRFLSLSGSNFDSRLLNDVLRCKKLEWLDLSYTGIRDTDLHNLEELKRLRVLDLSGNHLVGDEGIECLLDLPQLRVIRLNDTAVSEAGVIMCADNHAIEYLELKDTQVLGSTALRIEELTNGRIECIVEQ